MNIKVFQNRKVSKDYFDNEGTQNENYSTTLSFEVPLGYEDFSKRIVFITEDGNFWDYIKDNEYVIKNNITKYENVEAYLWLTKDNQDFRSETFELNFYENQNPDDMTPSEEQLDGYNTLIAELELKFEEVDALKEETLEALEKLKEQQIDYENRFKEINKMLKELKDTNEYQSEIIDQFKNEFDEKEFKGTNAHLPDSAELPLKLQPQGNIEQEVIEAVEGIVVEGSSISVNDVDTSYEDSIMAQGNIEQDTREGYNLIDTRNAYEVTKAGVTLTVDKETQEITLNGECTTDNTPFALNVPMECKAGDYTAGFKYVSGSVTIPSGKTSSINLQDSNWVGFVTPLNNNDVFTSQTISSDLSITYTVIRCDSGCVYNNFKIKPFLASGKDKPFDLYGAMPSIAFPSEVKGVSGHYDNVVENKNRFGFENLDSRTIAGITTTYEKSSAILNGTNETVGNFVGWADSKETHLARKIGTFKKGKYVFSINTSGKIVIPSGGCGFYLRNKNSLAKAYITPPTFKSDANYSTTFELTETTDLYAHMYVNTAGWTFEDFKIDFQIEEGTVLTPYIEHQEQNLPLDIPFNMYSGKAYKENGKWYRPIEFEKYVFTGNETYEKSTSYSNDTYFCGYIKPAIMKFKDSNISTPTRGLSNMFKGGHYAYSDLEECMNVGTQMHIRILASRLNENSATGLQAFLKELYDNGTPLYAVAPLKTPYAEEITDTTLIEQLEELQKAEFYDGVTNINSYKSSEDVANMPLEVHYNFITPSPSVKRPSEVLEVGSDEEINYYHIGDVEETTQYGVTYSIKNGRFKANGTATQSFTIATKNERFDLESDKYTLGGKVISGTYSGIVGKYVTQDGGTNVIDGNLIDTVGKKNLTEKVINVYASIYVNNGVVFNNFEADLMLVKGDYIKETLPLFTPPGYCRYETVVGNKNIYNANIGVEKGYLNSADGTVIKGSGWKVTDYIKIPDNVNVITLLNGWGKGEVHCFYDKNKNFIDAHGMGSSINTKKSIEDNYKYVRFTVSDIYKEDFMIAFGDTDTFIEHQEQQFPIDLPIGKVLYNEKPVVELTDAEIEELGLEKAELYFKDEWAKEYITSSSNVVRGITVYKTSRFVFKPTLKPIQMELSNQNYEIYSNMCKRTTLNQNYYAIEGLQYDTVSAKTDSIIIYLEATKDLTSGAEFKQYCANLETPLYVVYKLAKPIYTPIKDENFIKQYRDLQRAFSYYPVTNINSYKPTVNVADLILNGKYYVSNKAKFKTLEERVSALENETVNE